MLQQLAGLRPPLAWTKALLDETSQLRTLDGFQSLRWDTLEIHIHDVLEKQGFQRHTHLVDPKNTHRQLNESSHYMHMLVDPAS
jgi:hypothetical protein